MNDLILELNEMNIYVINFLLKKILCDIILFDFFEVGVFKFQDKLSILILKVEIFKEDVDFLEVIILLD